MGGVELGDPTRGLEHHGVALDETALVAEPAAAVALPGQRLRRRGGTLELDVHAVHNGLLVRDLALREVFGHLSYPSLSLIRQVL